ncbi:hypothetical protein HDU86_003799 [Geranomyces michiganensis]|nr:hypothetical protein HDU86_003799 [Geranomyces michiganensis]
MCKIDQKRLPLDGGYTYPDSAGAGVDIYIVDTGININHTEFEGRALWGITTSSTDSAQIDDHGSLDEIPLDAYFSTATY